MNTISKQNVIKAIKEMKKHVARPLDLYAIPSKDGWEIEINWAGCARPDDGEYLESVNEIPSVTDWEYQKERWEELLNEVV